MEQTSLRRLDTTTLLNRTNLEPEKKYQINGEVLLERLHLLITGSTARAAAEFPAFREDFTSESALAVLIAAKRFQPSKGEAEHFAARYLRGGLLNSRRSLRHLYREVPLDTFQSSNGEDPSGSRDDPHYQHLQTYDAVRRLENSVDARKIWGVAPTVLTANELQVISLIYLEDVTATEAAAQMKISVPRVSQLRTSALKKLRKHLGIFLS